MPSKSGNTFSESLTASLGKRKNKFKGISDALNYRINKEEARESYEPPIINVPKIEKLIEEVIEEQFVLEIEEPDLKLEIKPEPPRYIYVPENNLELCQTISKEIMKRIKAMEFSK